MKKNLLLETCIDESSYLRIYVIRNDEPPILESHSTNHLQTKKCFFFISFYHFPFFYKFLFNKHKKIFIFIYLFIDPMGMDNTQPVQGWAHSMVAAKSPTPTKSHQNYKHRTSRSMAHHVKLQVPSIPPDQKQKKQNRQIIATDY